MAHFAELDENNIVLRVVVVHNEELIDEYDQENEENGVFFCKEVFGENTRWIQTSYNKKMRKNFAGIGSYYDPERDAFIPAKKFNSWVLDETICDWIPPLEMPNDGKQYAWNEKDLRWEELDDFLPTMPQINNPINRI